MIKCEVSQLRVITKITQQKRLKDRYNIFLDNEYSFSVEESVIVTYSLQKDLSLSDEKIDEIMEAQSFQKAYLMAVNYISYRMRSIKEVQVYLRDKEIGKLEIEKIIESLLAKQYLDDAAFAVAFVRDKMNQTTKGPRVIKNELFEKGVIGKTAESAIAEYGFEEQFEVAFKWANAQQRKTNKHSHRKRRDLLRAGLMQKGFDGDVINDCLTEIGDEVDLAQEQVAIKHHGDRLLKRNKNKLTGYELTNKIKTGLYSLGFTGEMIDAYITEVTKKMLQ